MRKTLAAAAAALAWCGPAAAGTPDGYLDLFYVPSAKFEITDPGLGSGEDDGDGFGVKGMAPLSEFTVLTGEYQSIGYDAGFDIDQMRIGAGFMGARGGGVMVEYLDITEGIEADGFGAHLRLGSDNFYAQLGYLMLDGGSEDVTGPEFAVGFAADFSPTAGLFVDARRSMIEGEDSNVEVETTDIRVGVRFTFANFAR